MKKIIKILKTAVGSLSAVSIINEFKKHGVYVIGGDANPLSVGFYFSDKYYVLPYGTAPNFPDTIEKIIAHENLNAIFWGPEEEIISISKNLEKFEQYDTILFIPPYNVIMKVIDKFLLFDFLRRHKIPTPSTYRLEENTINRLLNKTDVNDRIILKPRIGRGSNKVIVTSPLELFESPQLWESSSGYIVQHFINGIEYSVDAFLDDHGNLFSIVPRVRLQTESGISIKGITIKDEEVIETVRRFLDKIPLQGPLCIQGIKSDEDGLFYITDVNLRFGGGSVLSLKADPTVILNYIRVIKGKPPLPSKGFKEGLLMLRYYGEYFTQLSESKITRLLKNVKGGGQYEEDTCNRSPRG